MKKGDEKMKITKTGYTMLANYFGLYISDEVNDYRKSGKQSRQMPRKERTLKLKRKIDQPTVTIIIGLTSILINIIFNGEDLLRNVRWILSYLH